MSLIPLVAGPEFSKIEIFVGGPMPDSNKRLVALMEEIGVLSPNRLIPADS